MARQGGPSTAAGVTYQALAIGRCIIEVYQGQADFVRAEVPPFAAFDGTEPGQTDLVRVAVDDFVVQRLGRRFYYQAKSNAPGGGSWTINKLMQEEILPRFADQLSSTAEACCQLVTPSECVLLGEIAQRAASAPNCGEFVANLGKAHAQEFDDACVALNVGKEAGYNLLTRCGLERRSADQLAQEIRSLSHVLFADPEAAADCLHSMAVHSMERSQQWDRTAIEAHFSDRAVFAKPRATEAELLDAIWTASSRLRGVGKTIAGVHIPQPTVEKIFAWMAKGEFKESAVAALLDQAGSGKTVAMSVLQGRLEAAGYKVLGIKVDGLPFSSAEELASVVGLPASVPSVVQTLRKCGHRVAVLIDQVDALSSAMSRNSAAITVVLDLVARLSSVGDVPVVLACRMFDWKYDSRLGALRERHPTQFSLEEATDDQLTQVLSVRGLTIKDLHPLTVKMVRCPLRLRVLMEVIEAHRLASPAWSPSSSAIYTLQALYQEFWTLKMRKAEADGVGAAACEEVAVALARNMHDTEQLAAPEALVATKRIACDWLVSESVLSAAGKALAFFHQTFFDFIFARWFVQGNLSLNKHLLQTDQGLFFRPMTRQILEYLRDVQPLRYLAELKGILEDQRIRKHLRWLTISWLGQQRDPRPGELDLLEGFLADGGLRRRTLMHLRGNPAWFDLLTPDRFGRWLGSLPDAEVQNVVWYLHFVLPERQEKVVSLLSPYVGRSKEWNDLIAFALAYLKSGWGQPAAQLLVDLLRSPVTSIDQGHNAIPYWGISLEEMAKGLPLKGCEAIGVILDRCAPTRKPSDPATASEEEEGQDDADWEVGLPQAHGFAEALDVLAEQSPAAFLQTVLPWTLDGMARTCRSYGDKQFRSEWRLWQWKDNLRDSPTERLMKSMAGAARNLSRAAPPAWRALMPVMLAGDFLPMQIVVAEALMASPAQFARDGADFLCSDHRRLRLTAWGESGWSSADLIKALCPHWTAADFTRVETAIMTLKAQDPKSTDELNWHNQLQFVLLRALDPGRLSQEGRNWLGQLERKFPDFDPEHHEPYEISIVQVGPPIQERAIEKMDDKGWLGVMKRYVSERERDGRPPVLSGGRTELSRALQRRAKEQPERFYRLALEQMDVTYHPDYVAAIITGAAEGEADVACVVQLIEKFLPLLGKGNIRQAIRAIDKYAEKQVPERLVDLVKGWLFHAADPQPRMKSCNQEEESKADHRDLVNEGINTDRGSAMWTLAKLLLKAKPPRQGDYLDVAERVVADSSPAVRAVCIHFLPYAMPANPPRACDLFRGLVGSDNVLLRERSAYDFIYHSLFRHADAVLWAIEAMLADQASNKAREAGAKLACLAAFEYPAAHRLRDSCLRGDVPVRKGAAAIYAANFAEPVVGAQCRERLRTLMSDGDHEVRDEVAGFWHHLEAADMRDQEAFLREWAQSRAIDEGADEASRALEAHATVNPSLTLDVAQRIIEALGAEITNIQKRHGGISYSLTPAILNVYHRSLERAVRTHAIDLFERLEELGCPQVPEALEAIDRL